MYVVVFYSEGWAACSHAYLSTPVGAWHGCCRGDHPGPHLPALPSCRFCNGQTCMLVPVCLLLVDLLRCSLVCGQQCTPCLTMSDGEWVWLLLSQGVVGFRVGNVGFVWVLS